MGYLIGIDAGTSRVKAVLFDLDGKEKKIVYRDNEPIYTGTSHVDQDMDVLWEKVLICLKELVKDVDKNEIFGIGVTGQGEGCWLIDKEGRPVSKAILWNDGRAKDLVDEIVSNEKLNKLIYETTGTPVLTGTALTLLKWSKLNRKDVLDKAYKLLFCKDWIRYKLTGKIGLELSDTATSLINIKTLEVAENVLEALDLIEYRHLISNVSRSYEIVGDLTDKVAEETGLKKETPVGAGAIDVIATTMGIGAIKNGDICSILGTTCATMIVSDKCYPGKENTRFEMHALDNLYVNLQPTMSGTPNIDWMLNNISDTKSFKEIDERISKIKPGSSGVLYHPYISTSGERSPFYNPNARASFFGINTNTTRFDLVRAVYEGIALSIRDCLESSNSNDGTIYLAGGGAESKSWAQIISDCTNRTVEVSDGNEFAAKGTIIMLGVALGLYKNYEDAVKRTCRSKAIYKPTKENITFYEKIYKLYRNARISFNNLWHERYSILKEVGKGEY